MGFISELIGYPLGWIMYLIYAVFKNYGISLLIFTIVTRLCLVPISVNQQKSMASMQAINPKLEKLKKQYANNPNKLQEEQMKLYSEENINPMASCLPMILQLLFLYGVFDVVYKPLSHILRIGKDTITALTTAAAPLFEGNNYFKIRPELYILQAIKDDPSAFSGVEGISAEIIQKIADFDYKLFDIIDLGVIPNIVFNEGTVWNAATIGLFMIPVVSGLIQIIMLVYNLIRQKKQNSDAAAQMGSMNIMLIGMTIFSIYLAFTYPAGIGFYWICSSLVGFVQTMILNKVITPEYVSKLVEKDKAKQKNKKKSAFMEKYNEMLQEQIRQNSQNNQNNGRIVASGVTKDDDGNEIKLSKSQMKEYERKIIAEARRRQAEKYGDEYVEDDE